MSSKFFQFSNDTICDARNTLCIQAIHHRLDQFQFVLNTEINKIGIDNHVVWWTKRIIVFVKHGRCNLRSKGEEEKENSINYRESRGDCQSHSASSTSQPLSLCPLPLQMTDSFGFRFLLLDLKLFLAFLSGVEGECEIHCEQTPTSSLQSGIFWVNHALNERKLLGLFCFSLIRKVKREGKEWGELRRP